MHGDVHEITITWVKFDQQRAVVWDIGAGELSVKPVHVFSAHVHKYKGALPSCFHRIHLRNGVKRGEEQGRD